MKKGERVKAIILYLANKDLKCATLEELLEALKPVHQRSTSKDLKMQTLVTLSRMKKSGLIQRSWMRVDSGTKRRKRLYCLRSDYVTV